MPSIERLISHDRNGNLQCLLDVIVRRCDLNAVVLEPNLTFRSSFPALIDTEATNTCISTEIVTQLNLTSDEIVPINTASHKSVQVKLFQIDLTIPILSDLMAADNRLKQELALFTAKKLNVTELQHHDKDYHILLGMDVLAKCNFFMAHGRLVLSY